MTPSADNNLTSTQQSLNDVGQHIQDRHTVRLAATVDVVLGKTGILSPAQMRLRVEERRRAMKYADGSATREAAEAKAAKLATVAAAVRDKDPREVRKENRARENLERELKYPTRCKKNKGEDAAFLQKQRADRAARKGVRRGDTTGNSNSNSRLFMGAAGAATEGALTIDLKGGHVDLTANALLKQGASITPRGHGWKDKDDMTVDTLYIGADVETLRDTLAMVPLTPTPTQCQHNAEAKTKTNTYTKPQHIRYHNHYHYHTQDIERAKAAERQAAMAAREAGLAPSASGHLEILYDQESRLNGPNSPLLVPIAASRTSIDKVLPFFIDSPLTLTLTLPLIPTAPLHHHRTRYCVRACEDTRMCAKCYLNETACWGCRVCPSLGI